MSGEQTPTERTRDYLLDQLRAALPSTETVMADTSGAKIVFADVEGRFWTLTVSAAHVVDAYQGPG